jgi:hypothetical protein
MPSTHDFHASSEVDQTGSRREVEPHEAEEPRQGKRKIGPVRREAFEGHHGASHLSRLRPHLLAAATLKVSGAARPRCGPAHRLSTRARC